MSDSGQFDRSARGADAVVLDRVRAAGESSGGPGRLVSSFRMTGRLDAQAAPDGPVSRGAESTLRDVALSKAAEAEGRVFAARYLKNGFMLASPVHNVARHEEQRMQASKATTDDLQAVLRVTAERRGALEMQEPRMRAQEIVRLHPEKMEARFAKLPGDTREEKFEAFVKSVSRWDFSEQQKWSTDPETKKWPVAPEQNKVTIGALSRGYRAISDVLSERGVVPDVMAKGAMGPRPLAAKEAAPRSKLMRDGVEL